MYEKCATDKRRSIRFSIGRCQDIGGILDMYSDALKIMDRNTVQLMIDEMQEKLAGAMGELEGTKEKMQEQADEIKQQAARIKELESLLGR